MITFVYYYHYIERVCYLFTNNEHRIIFRSYRFDGFGMQRRRERKCVNYNVYLQIKEFTCESMYHNSIVIKIKMSQSLT